MENSNLEEMYKTYPNFDDIIWHTSLLSMIVYEDKPKEFLENKPEYRHNIRSMCCSHTHTEDSPQINKLADIQYLIAETNINNKKQLIVCFKGTNSTTDIIEDAKNYPLVCNMTQRFLTGFYKRANLVPIRFFLEKLSEEYELIFTGHGLGAATAAMVTINLLLLPNMTDEFAEKILFIGYGSPCLADAYFKEKLDDKYKERFIFIKNSQDIVVEIFDYLSWLVYAKDRTLEPDIFNFVKIVSDYLSAVLATVNQNLEAQNELDESSRLSSISKNLKVKLVTTFFDIELAKYKHFGNLLRINEENYLTFDEFSFNRDSLISFLNCPDASIEQLKHHKMIDYFINLSFKMNNFEGKIDLSETRTIPIVEMNDLIVKDIGINDVKIVKNEFNSDIFISFNKKYQHDNQQNTFDSIAHSLEYLLSVKLKANRTIEPIDICINEDFDNYFKFECPNEFIFNDDGNLKIEKMFLELIFHFNHQPLILETTKEEWIRTEGISWKQNEIYDMPFDLLYMHAAFYMHLIGKLKSKIAFPECDKALIVKKEKLEKIFIRINELANKLKYNPERQYNQEEKNEMEEMLNSYFNYKISDKERETLDTDFVDFRNDFCISNQEEINFDNDIIKVEERKNISLNPEDLLFSTIKFNYQIKRKLETNVSDKLVQKSFGKELDILLKIAGSDIPVTPDQKTMFSEGAQGFFRRVLRMKSVNLRRVPFNFIFQIAIRKVISWFLNFDKLDKNRIYIAILFLTINKENFSKPLYFREKMFDEVFRNKWDNEKDKIIFEIIHLNSQIREILVEDYLIGVIGSKKSGKSTTVELITGLHRGSAPDVPTRYATPNKLCNRINLIDYPHIESNSMCEKLEFFFTRVLMNHIVIIFDTKMKGETNTETELYNLVTRNNFKDFTILYNNTDFLVDLNRDFDPKTFLDKIQERLDKNLNKNQIHLTCLKEHLDEHLKDRLLKNEVLLREDFKTRIFYIIDDMIKKDKEHKKLNECLEKQRHFAFKSEKKIIVEYKNTDRRYKLTLKNLENNEMDTFSSFESLIAELKYTFRIKEEQDIRISNEGKEMRNIMDFFNCKFSTFQVELINSNK